MLSLTEVSKRINPVLGGIISGLPLGTGLAVYFISLQMGNDFLPGSIPWGICGLSSSLMFCLVYLVTGRLLKKVNRIVSAALSSIAGMFLFFISAFVIFEMKLNIILSIVFFLAVFIVNYFIMAMLVKNNAMQVKKNSAFISNIVRALAVGIIVVAITGIAAIVGSRWSAILSAFPSTLYPLLLILHIEEGDNYYPAVIRGFSLGISTLAVFYLSCIFFIPRFGLNTGFILIYLISILYLVILNTARSLIESKFRKVAKD